MLLITLLLVATALFVIVGYASDRTAHDEAAFCFTMLATISFIVLVALIIVACANNIGVEGDTVEMQKKYDSLYYQASTGMYDNPNEVGKEGLAEQITKWNSTLARGKSMKHNVWVSALYPIDYDKFEEIPLSLLKKNE